MTSMNDSENAAADSGYSGLSSLMRALLSMVQREKWLIVLLFVAVAGAELGLRAFWPQLSGLVYSPVVTGGHEIIVTDKAFRVPSGERETGATTVLAIGDSTTFGTGVSAAETWPLRLPDYLKNPVLVRNAGIEGSDPRQQIIGLNELWSDPTPPQIVVLLVTGNMVSFTEFRKDSPATSPLVRAQAIMAQSQAYEGSLKQRVKETLQSSALWKAVSLNVDFGKYGLGLHTHRVSLDAPLSPLLAYGWQQPDLPKDYIPLMWVEFQAALTELHLQTQSLGSCLVVGFLPPRFMLSEARLDNLKFIPRDRLMQDAEVEIDRLVEQLDIPFVPNTKALRTARELHGPLAKPYFIPGDYTHLDAYGHDVVASNMAAVVEPILSGRAPCNYQIDQ